MKKLLIGLIVVIALTLIGLVSWKMFQVFIVKGIEYIFSQDYTHQVDFNENNTLSNEDENILKEIYDLNKEITSFKILYVNYDALEYQGESSASILIEVDKNELDSKNLFNSTQHNFNVETIEENDDTKKFKIELVSMGVSVDTNYNKIKEIVNKYNNNKQINIDSIKESSIYKKEINNTEIQFDLKDWHFEEIDISDPYRKADSSINPNIDFELKIYKEKADNYISLCYYKQAVGLCGTFLETEKLKLANGKEAYIRYYDGSDIWSIVDFGDWNTNYTFVNRGLNKADSDEFLEIIKTVDFNNKN